MIKNRIVRSASLQAERLYEALVRQQKQKCSDPDAPFIDRSDLVFDPTRPTETDWDSILKQAADKILRTYKTKPGHQRRIQLQRAFHPHSSRGQPMIRLTFNRQTLIGS